MGTSQIPGSSNPVQANWKQSKTFWGFKSGAAFLTFFFHLLPFPPFFCSFFFFPFPRRLYIGFIFTGKVWGKLLGLQN